MDYKSELELRIFEIEDIIKFGNWIKDDFDNKFESKMIVKSIGCLEAIHNKLTLEQERYLNHLEVRSSIEAIENNFAENYHELFRSYNNVESCNNAEIFLNRNLEFAERFPKLEKLYVSINKLVGYIGKFVSNNQELKLQAWKDIETIIEYKQQNSCYKFPRDLYERYHNNEMREEKVIKTHLRNGNCKEDAKRYFKRPELEYIDIINAINECLLKD